MRVRVRVCVCVCVCVTQWCVHAAETSLDGGLGAGVGQESVGVPQAKATHR